MKQIIQALFFLMSTANLSFAQEINQTNPNVRINRPLGVSIYGLGTYGVLAGIAMDAFLSPKTNAEIHFSPIGILGDVINIGGGINYHIWGKNENLKWSPYMGLDISYSFREQFLSGNEKKYKSFYLPLGVHFIGKKGFNFSADVGLAYYGEARFDSDSFSAFQYYTTPMASFKIGYRFKLKSRKEN